MFRTTNVSARLSLPGSSSPGSLIMAASLREAGWQAIWGKALPPLSPQEPWAAEYGGVGILVRNGIPATRGANGSKDTDSAVRRRLWHTGRWVHAVVAYGDGGAVMHIMSLNGYPNAEREEAAGKLNEELLRGTFEAAAELLKQVCMH